LGSNLAEKKDEVVHEATQVNNQKVIEVDLKGNEGKETSSVFGEHFSQGKESAISPNLLS